MIAVQLFLSSKASAKLPCGHKGRWRIFVVCPNAGGRGVQINQCWQCRASWELAQ